MLMATAANAHEWYAHRSDPVTNGQCCGGSDCSILKIDPGVLTGEADGYRVRLTIDQARRINPMRLAAIDTLVPWSRVQVSEDGNFHICIPNYPMQHMVSDFYCFFAPGNT